MYRIYRSIIVFLRSCIKTSIVSDWSWKVMSAQLNAPGSGNGQTLIEEWLIGKRMLNLKFTVMRGPDLQRITSLGFKTFQILGILKLLSGIIYLIFVTLFHFRPMFSLYGRG